MQYDPITNFEIWFSNAGTYMINPAKSETYFKVFEGFLSSILQTGFLPELISNFTEMFLQKLPNQIVKRLINKDKLEDAQLPTIKQYLDLFLKFSLYGLCSLEKNVIEIAVIIVGNKDEIFYLSRHSVYKSMCKAFVDNNAMKIITQVLKDPVQDLELYGMLLTITSAISGYDTNFELQPFIYSVTESLNNYVKQNSNTLKVSHLNTCIEEFRNVLPNNEKIINFFISNFLPMLTIFFQSNNFEQRLDSLKEVGLLASDRIFQIPISNYFMSNLSFLINLEFNEKYASSIGDIFSVLSHYASIPIDFIKTIWDKHNYLHASEKNNFFSMFLRFSDYSSGEILKTTIDCVMSLPHSFEWYDLLDRLLDSLNHKKQSVEFLVNIREFLKGVAFNKNDPLHERAKRSLLKMITYGANEDTFKELVFLLSNNTITDDDKIVLDMLNNFFRDDSKIKISVPIINETLDKMVDLICLISDPPKPLKDFLANLSNSSRKQLTNEQIIKLSTNVFPGFFSFLDELSFTGLITSDHLEILIEKFDVGDKSFFKLIKHLISEANSTNGLVTKLPLKKEDIMWQFALRDIQHRDEFEKLLCQMYASNDGVELTDHVVIDTFIEKWYSYYINEPSSKLISILRTFVYTWESQSALNFEYAHNFDSRIVDVIVYWVNPPSSMKFYVPPSTTIGSIIEKIVIAKNIQLSTPVLSVHSLDTFVKRTQQVSVDAQPNKDKLIATYDISYRKHTKNKLHIRNIRASSEIINQIWINNLFKKLYENDRAAYELFKLLPRYKSAISFYDPEINLSDVFNLDQLCYFLYNFITLLNECKTDNELSRYLIEKKDIDIYLINVVEYIIIDKELNETTMELGKYFLDFFYLIPPIRPSQKLFFVLMKMSTIPLFFDSVKNAANKQFPKGSQRLKYTDIENNDSTRENNVFCKFDFDEDESSSNNYNNSNKTENDEFENILKMLLFNPNPNIKQFAVEQFKKIILPVHFFVDILQNFGEAVTEEFFATLTYQLSEEFFKYPDFSSVVLRLLYSDSAHGEFLVYILDLVLNMLRREIVNPSDLPTLFEFLINRFISFDIKKDDRIAFETASRCIVQISSVLLDNDILRNTLEQHHVNRKPFHQFQIPGDDYSIEYNKVGLKNLGMTCYLNATLQQFYAIKPFRYSIMAYTGNDVLINQLAKLFESMKYCKTRSVTTQDFVDNFLYWGSKLNPRVQQDAAEFIQTFLDNLKGDPSTESLINNLFVNERTQIIEDIDLDHEVLKITRFSEPIFELEVKELNDMIQSFEHFSKPSYFTGDQMYGEGPNKRNARSRDTLSNLPPFLIIQLKRFDYGHSVNQSQKISKKYEVYDTIDLTKYNENQEEATYSLSGVVIHRGIAQGGHFVSLVKTKKNGWLCFDDEVVTKISETEAMIQAAGNETTKVTGYILFYKRMNVDVPYPIPRMSQERNEEIHNLNQVNIQLQLFCSSGYYELMKGLSTLPITNYLDLVCYYSIDTLPYAKKALESECFYDSLSTRLKSTAPHDNSTNNMYNITPFNNQNDFRKLFIEYLCSGFLTSILFECPVNQIRKGVCKLIKSCFDVDDDPKLIPFAQEVFKLVPNCLFTYQHMDELFNVLAYLIKFPSIKHIAESEWKSEICDLFETGISNLYAANSTLKPSYIFKGMDLSHFVKFICNLNLGGPGVFNDGFYFNCCISKTSPKKVSLLTHTYFSKDDFRNILPQIAIESDNFTFMSLLFHVIPEEAINLSTEMEIKKIGKPCTLSDIITIIASVLLKYPNIGNTLMEYRDEWLKIFLIDDNLEARSNAAACIFYLVPSEKISKQSYLDLNISEDLYLPEMNVKTRENDQEIIDRSFLLLQSIMKLIPTVVRLYTKIGNKKSKSKEDHRATQLLQVVSELGQFIQQPFNFSPIAELYVAICQNEKNLFSDQVVEAMSIILKYNIPITFEDLFSAFPPKMKAKDYTNNFCTYTTYFLLYLQNHYQLSKEFITYFFDNLVMVPISRNLKFIDSIKSFLKFLCDAYHSHVNSLYMSKGKKLESTNIILYICMCKLFHKQRSLLEPLLYQMKDLIKIGVDVSQLILDALECNSPTAFNEEIIDALCSYNEINDDVKGKLRGLLHD
ncbi:hypothetical protein TRFO_13027 [Tritrichomonas foetus]|uniref:USP domain-containing protein n=1 Tax=Tritrichomonas foetus TaxID=1144522 RepID=A0A1J4L0F6_9EUKA|nr:hypothetical protein TRFO_13027 [Tritrichomonas foetus]|eukprot:OHT16616.1 hypothetical protein TRFO_13027 [Tritrichomonas foetus]